MLHYNAKMYGIWIGRCQSDGNVRLRYTDGRQPRIGSSHKIINTSYHKKDFAPCVTLFGLHASSCVHEIRHYIGHFEREGQYGYRMYLVELSGTIDSDCDDKEQGWLTCAATERKYLASFELSTGMDTFGSALRKEKLLKEIFAQRFPGVPFATIIKDVK